MIFRHETFYCRKIEVNGHRFYGCHFRKCILIAQATMPEWIMRNCRMDDCEFLGDGWPGPQGTKVAGRLVRH